MSLMNILAPVLKWHIRAQSQKSLINYDENVKVNGLNKKVRIQRDKWAVPHIEAENEQDLFFAQGFIHAQERLWQMEMNRRVSQGRLSELFGKIAFDSDRLLRTLGFNRLGKSDWQRYQNQEIGAIGAAYCAGVNAWLEQCKNLPAEFKLLKIKPEKWVPSDCLAYGRFISFRMSYGWLHELERLQLAQQVGVEKALELHPEYPSFNPAILHQGIETHKVADGKLEAFNGPFLPKLGGSNSWSVSPELMENGSAVLCNDPHLALNMPNIWFENHLICPDYEVSGVSLLGVPMVLIGHNRDIAWGATLSFVDMQDTYIETFTDDSSKSYKFGDEIKQSIIVEEKIKVKGVKTVHSEKVIYTHHGPVISDLLGVKDRKISLQSGCLKENDMLLGFYSLNKAGNWNEFVEACAHIKAPSLNLNYADRDNNIGYYVTGQVPIRRKDEDLFPRNGSSTEFEWTGHVPFEEMPHALNPARGYVFTCNNKVVNDDYPYDLGNVWMNGYRASRLEMLFKSKNKYSIEDFKKWQLDFHSIPGLQFAALFKKLIEGKKLPQIPLFQTVVNNFINWDGQLTAESTGGCIYQVFKQSLIDCIMGEELEKSRLQGFRGEGPKPPLIHDNEFWGHDSTTLLRILENPEKSKWLKESPADTVIKAMSICVDFLIEKFGTDIKTWQWGKLHQMRLMHVLGAQKPLDKIFNIEGIAMGGDTDTLCQVAFQPGNHYGGTLTAASYRQIIDMGDFDKSVCSFPGGQSGNLLSPHRNDQMEDWLKGEFKPMVWSKEQREENKKYEMWLEKG
jgi:penicillin G amidase